MQWGNHLGDSGLLILNLACHQSVAVSNLWKSQLGSTQPNDEFNLKKNTIRAEECKQVRTRITQMTGLCAWFHVLVSSGLFGPGGALN